MATGVVAEFRSALVQNNSVTNVPDGPPLRCQEVSFTTTAATANAIGDDCGLVGFFADANAWVHVAVSPNGDNGVNRIPVAANTWFFQGNKPGQSHKVAFAER